LPASSTIRFLSAAKRRPGFTMNLKTNQVRCKLFQAIIAFAFCKPILDGDILSLDPAEFAQVLPERGPKT
jgi:hypothetical protein